MLLRRRRRWQRRLAVPERQQPPDRGRRARLRAGVQPYCRPGYRHGLEGPSWLDDPVTLAELRQAEDVIRTAREVVGDFTDGSLYFPVALTDSRPLRPTQFYVTKFPVVLTEIFPQLAEALEKARQVAWPRHSASD